MRMQKKYCITVSGLISRSWSKWFSGFNISYANKRNGEKISNIIGYVRDQSELLGLIKRISELNLSIISINEIDIKRRKADEKSGNSDEP